VSKLSAPCSATAAFTLAPFTEISEFGYVNLFIN
jgi:hypothetical protein